MDALKNFAKSLVATAPSPAASGTSLVVTGGEGTKFPAPSFRAVIWPTATDPTSANAEIVRVSGLSTDTLTIVRAQEGTSARTVVVGDQIAQNVTAAMMKDAGIWRPQLALAPANALSETFPRVSGAQMQSATVLTSQTLFLQAIDLPNDTTITSISFFSGTTGLSTGVHQIFGLYDDSSGSSSGTARALLRGTSDDTSTAWAATTIKTLNLTSTYKTVRAGLHYIGILVQATTVPLLLTAITQPAGWGSLPAPIVCGNSSTGQTALPNPAAAISAAGLTMAYAWVS